MTLKTVLLDDATGQMYAQVVPSGSSAPPTLIPQDTTYTVPTDAQILTFSRCKVEGTLVINGDLQ